VGDTGFAGLLGAGYELRLGRRIYLNPAVDYFGLGVLFQTGK
jgi:hypothetical protein